MSYNSKYTGAEVEEAIGLAKTALQPNELAKVAKSGSYNDLNDKPSIPDEVTEETVEVWGFTKNQGDYSKPSTGIPKSDLASAVQTSLNKADTALQSHQQLKTINGESLVGLGNIKIDSAYGVVNHGTGDTTFALTPNVLHVWDEVGALSVSLGAAKEGVVNEYLFQFTSGATATTLSVPDTIKWVTEPSIEPNKTYQISVVDNIGLIVGV